MKVCNLPFPDCMMPDGAPPCDSYVDLVEIAKKLECQNEALLAQVEELKRAMLYEAGETRAEFNVPDDVTLLLETVANKFPEQHLDSLKLRIEEETIDLVNIHQTKVVDGFIAENAIDKDTETVLLFVVTSTEDMPRKYQPSNHAKVDK